MRKRSLQNTGSALPLNPDNLKALKQQGFKYVQIKGMTLDSHYDYVEPSYLMLVPMRELPTDPTERDIYEPVESTILRQWAQEQDEHCSVLILNQKKAG